MTTLKRLRGLRSLIGDAVEHGSKAVEDVHLATAARTFVVLEAIPPLAKPAHVVHVVHDASVSGVYGLVRVVNRVVGKTLDVAMDVAERERDRTGNGNGNGNGNAQTRSDAADDLPPSVIREPLSRP